MIGRPYGFAVIEPRRETKEERRIGPFDSRWHLRQTGEIKVMLWSYTATQMRCGREFDSHRLHYRKVQNHGDSWLTSKNFFSEERNQESTPLFLDTVPSANTEK